MLALVDLQRFPVDVVLAHPYSLELPVPIQHEYSAVARYPWSVVMPRVVPTVPYY